ncbi:MAG TPA: tetratricopeptide repeat protein [Pirellulales bacterium]|jgi:tetratricopeptide (TPR) repeat protein|nr:tetratricopeptide repeat protein [Pirellulales bacterium]
MKKLNLKLLISLVVVTVCLGLGLYFGHAMQLKSNEGSLKKEAEALVQEGKKAEALKRYTAYLQQNQNDPAVYVATAKLAVEIANTDPNPETLRQAYNELNKGLQRNQDNAELRESYAEFMMRVGYGMRNLSYFEDAATHLEWLTDPKRGKHEPKLDLLLIECYVERAYFDKAMDRCAALTGYDLKSNVFDVGKARAATEPDAYDIMAHLMREKLEPHQPKQADAVMEQLVKVNKDSFKAHLYRARYLQQYLYLERAPAAKEAMLKESNAELASAIKLAPEDADVILAAAKTTINDKDYKKSEQWLVRGLELFPKKVDMYRVWAALMLEQDRAADARKQIEQGLKVLPNNLDLLWILAEIEMQQRDLEATRGTLKALGNLKFRSDLLEFMEARILFTEQKWLPASQQFERLRPQLASLPQQQLQCDIFAAQCYQELGQYDKQLDASRRVLAADPTNVAAQVGIANALMNSGRPDEAKKAYEQIRAALGEKSLSIKQIWVPSIEILMADQMKLPPEKRDFTRIENVIAKLEQDKKTDKKNTVSDSEIALIKAEVQFRKGDLSAAYKTLDDARAKSPNDPAVWSALATITLQQKDAAAALKVLDQAPAEIRGNVALRLNRAGMILHQKGENVKAALAELDSDTDKLSPSDRSRLWSGLGSALLSIGDREGAMRYWGKVAQAEPDDLKIRFNLFDAAREIGDPAVMTSVLDDVRRIMGKNSPDAQYVEAARMVSLVRKAVRERTPTGRQPAALESDERQTLASARKLLESVSQARPGWPEVSRLLGDADLLDGNGDGAISHYKQALKDGPPNSVMIRSLVTLLAQRDRTDEIGPLLDMLGPQSLKAMNLDKLRLDARFKNEKDKDNINTLIEEAKQEVADDSHDPYGHLWIGNLYARADKKENAEASYRRAVKYGAEIPETWLVLVDFLVNNKMNAEASKVLMEARKDLPEDRVNEVLARGYEALGEPVLAEEYYRAQLQSAPNDLWPHRNIASFYMRNGRTDDARKEVVKILRDSQNDPKEKELLLWARRLMSEILMASGDFEDFKAAKSLLIANTKIDDGGAEDRLRLANLLASRFDEPATLREALKWFEAAETPKNPLRQLDKMTVARIHEVLGEWDLARGEMLALVSQSKADPNLYGVFVDMLIRNNQVADADSWLDKLNSVQKGAGLLLRAQVRVKQGRPIEAIALLNQILPPRPVPKNQASQLRTVALLMDQLELHTQAEELYREYMTYEPGVGSLQLAAFLGRIGRLDDALDLCETALQTQPRASALQAIDEVLHGQPRRVEPRHFERVGKWFDGLLRDDPESPALLMEYANFLSAAGQDDKAAAIYRDVLKRSDLTAVYKAETLNNLAFVLAGQRKNLPEALDLVNQSAKILGPKSDVLDTRGMIYLTMEKYPEAVADFSEAVLVLHPTAVKFLHLAMAQDLAKNRDAARSAFQKAKEKRLDSAALSKIEQGFNEQLTKDIGP